MGYLNASSMIQETDSKTAIEWHLQSNLYPPVPLTMVEPCLQAIDACWDEDYHRHIELPAGVLYRGEPTAPAHAIVEQHRLEAWLDGLEED